MNAEPLDLAIRAVTETRRMLELVRESPDSFAYHLAKRAVAELQAKIRVLARVWARASESGPEPNAPPALTVVPDPNDCA